MGWRIELQQVESIATVFELQCRTIKSVREIVSNIRDNCAVTGQNLGTVVNTLDNLMRTMDREVCAVKSMGKALQNIIGVYGACEQRLVGNAVQQKPVTTGKTEEGAWTWQDTWDLLAEGGIVGAGVSMIGNGITGERDGKTIINSGKYLNSIIGNAADAIAEGGTKTEWTKYLFGTNDALSNLSTSSGSKAFVNSWEKQFYSDLSFKNTTGIADKVSVGTKWGGHVLNLLTNGWENYEEFQTDGISAERAVAETVVETGVDIGLGALATAGVSAAAVALGFTAAPAFAIGVGAALATWAVNGICKWLTGGDDLGEVTANVICGVGEMVNSLKKITAEWAKAFA